MVGTKRSCPGTSTNATVGPGRQRRPGEAEVEGHAAPALLRPPVRLHPGQRPHQRGLAVVDVAGGGDDVHVSHSPGGCGQHRAAERARRRSASTARRSSRQRPRSSRPSTAGSPVRSRLRVRRRQAHRRARQRHARARRRRPPRPTLSTASASTPDARSSAAQPVGPRPQRRRVGRSARAVGGAGPRSVASSAARVSLSTRSARASGCRRSRVDHVGPAEQQPGLRAAEQLVAARGDQRGAGPQRGRGVRLVRQRRQRARAARSRCRPPPGAGSVASSAVGTAGGEAGDHEVGRVHLEHEAGVRADRGGVVGQA